MTIYYLTKTIASSIRYDICNLPKMSTSFAWIFVMKTVKEKT